MIGVLDYADAYKKIMPLMGHADLVDDERFNTISAVQQHLDEFMPILRAGFMTDTRDNWVRRIGEQNIVIGKIGHLKELAYDEQAIANKFVVPVTFPSGKTVQMPTVPVQFSAYDVGAEYEPTGSIGRDDYKILAGIGYSEAEIAALKEKGVTK